MNTWFAGRNGPTGQGVHGFKIGIPFPVSPVRTRTACSTGVTNILPSPDLAGIGGFPDLGDHWVEEVFGDDDFDFYLGDENRPRIRLPR